MLNKFINEIVIDQRSVEPIHEQLITQLEIIISRGRFSNNQEIMTAKELSDILHIDLKEVELTYEYLKENNYIDYSDKGFPYVTKYSRIINFFNRIIFIQDGIESMGNKASVDLLGIEVVELESFALLDLKIFKDKRFLKHTRLYKNNGNPYIYLEEFYPIGLFPELLDIDRNVTSNIYLKFIKDKYDVVFNKHKRHVNVKLFDQEIALIMGVKKGLPGFKVDMVSYDQNMRPFSFGYAYSLPYFYFEYDVELTK